MSLTWELLNDTRGYVERAKIPGGWLVRWLNYDFHPSLDAAQAGLSYGGITFVPDPEHTWDGKSLP
jgi:hypothetical protein